MAGRQPALAIALAVGRKEPPAQVHGCPPVPAALKDTGTRHQGLGGSHAKAGRALGRKGAEPETRFKTSERGYLTS